MSSHSQRLSHLEKAAPNVGVRCPTCGGPDPCGRRISFVSDSHPLRHCEDCGNPIDSNSKPLGEWRGGELRLKVIVFRGGASVQS